MRIGRCRVGQSAFRIPCNPAGSAGACPRCRLGRAIITEQGACSTTFRLTLPSRSRCMRVSLRLPRTIRSQSRSSATRMISVAGSPDTSRSSTCRAEAPRWARVRCSTSSPAAWGVAATVVGGTSPVRTWTRVMEAPVQRASTAARRPALSERGEPSVPTSIRRIIGYAPGEGIPRAAMCKRGDGAPGREHLRRVYERRGVSGERAGGRWAHRRLPGDEAPTPRARSRLAPALRGRFGRGPAFTPYPPPPHPPPPPPPRASISTGFTRWWSKPAAWVRSRSHSWP